MRILFTTILTFIILVSAKPVFAAELFFQSSAQRIHNGQEIAVDIMLLPQNESINALDVTIGYPSNMVFVSSQDGESIVGTWIERPTDKNGHISFSGIMPNGFSGFIDPLHPEKRSPGRMVRLVFKAAVPGNGIFQVASSALYINDGQGTLAPTTSSTYPIAVDSVFAPTRITINDLQPPESFSPLWVRDPQLSNDKPVVLFDTRDLDSGIAYYQVKEGFLSWKTTSSPYVIRVNALTLRILVRAVDHAGNATTESVTIPHGVRLRVLVNICIIAAFLIAASYVILMSALRRSS